MNKTTQSVILIGVIIIVILAILGIRIVDEGSVGVKKSFGKAERILSPGLFVITPLKDSIVSFDIRTRKLEGDESSASKDLQSISATIAVNYRIDIDKVLEIYSQLGTNINIEETIIKPAISESLKASTALFTAEENITKREDLKRTVEEKLAARFERFGITLEAVSIQNLSFSPQFDQAIEHKQVAEQQAKQAQFEQEKAIVQSETRIIEARAEAERQRLLRESINSDLLQKQWIDKWDGKLPTYVGGGDNSMLLQIPNSQ